MDDSKDVQDLDNGRRLGQVGLLTMERGRVSKGSVEVGLASKLTVTMTGTVCNSRTCWIECPSFSSSSWKSNGVFCKATMSAPRPPPQPHTASVNSHPST